MGSVKKIDESTVEVQDDFDLVAWDFVSDPSTQGAFMKPINENMNSKQNTNDVYESIKKCITEIILSYNHKI